ncbi:hypothetical protein BN871_IW_00090, partial [Paenibacillus sp. P22]
VRSLRLRVMPGVEEQIALREREIVHAMRFKESVEIIKADMGQKKVY